MALLWFIPRAFFSGVAFMLHLLLVSGAEALTSRSMIPLVGVSETLKEETSRNLHTFSVIVIADTKHSAALFLDRARIEAYAGSRVTAVQFGYLNQADKVASVPGTEPFGVGHPDGVDERIRIVHVGSVGGPQTSHPNENQIAHLKASCEDQRETTIVILTDEVCIGWDFWSTPCGSNDSYVFRHYPSSLPSPEEAPRHAYIPLGPRDTFPFIKRSRRTQPLASSRDVLFNVQVTPGTSPRRDALINITNAYALQHPEIQVHLSDERNLLTFQWQRLLQRSKFTISPGGHNPITFRMFEALETGSIPIVSKQDYLDPAYRAPHPCGKGSAAWNTVSASPFAQAVSVGSWEDLPQLLDRLALMADDATDQLQVESEQWYAALMHGAYASLVNFSRSPKFWPQDGPIKPLGLRKPT